MQYLDLRLPDNSLRSGLLSDVNWVLATKARRLVAPLPWNFLSSFVIVGVQRRFENVRTHEDCQTLDLKFLTMFYDPSMMRESARVLSTSVQVLSANISILALLNSDSQS